MFPRAYKMGKSPLGHRLLRKLGYIGSIVAGIVSHELRHEWRYYEASASVWTMSDLERQAPNRFREPRLRQTILRYAPEEQDAVIMEIIIQERWRQMKPSSFGHFAAEAKSFITR